MSEEKQTEEEPSIEEILDSIRQIISEDEEIEEDTAAPAEDNSPEEPVVDEPSPEPEPEPEGEPMDQSAIDDIDFDAPAAVEEPEPESEPVSEPEDVLELTELVNAEENNLDIDMIEGDAEDEAEEVVEEAQEPEPDPVVDEEPPPEPEPEPVQEPEPEPEPVQDDNDSILTDGAENAAMAAISNLVRKTAIGQGGLTLEDIVRAELKPLLRAWLDKHLPGLIERLVKEELERVTKQILDD